MQQRFEETMNSAGLSGDRKAGDSATSQSSSVGFSIFSGNVGSARGFLSGLGVVGDPISLPHLAPASELDLTCLQSLVEVQADFTRSGSASTGSYQQVVVSIQAMDSQSFTDRSIEAKQAVLDATLNVRSINDVICDR